MTKTTQDIGNELVAFCRADDTATGLKTLYAPDAVSVEAFMPDGGDRETKGIEGIAGKHDWWEANFEVHSAQVDGPYPSGDDRFAVIFEIDSTHRQSGQRSQMKEIGLYHVSGGKIVREEFFYPMG